MQPPSSSGAVHVSQDFVLGRGSATGFGCTSSHATKLRSNSGV